MASETRYWRCPKCGGVHSTNDGTPWLCYCATTDRGPLLHSTPEPVAVVPLAEHEELLRLKAAVEEVLGWAGVAPAVMDGLLNLLPEVDRAALRERMKGGGV